MKNTYLLLIFLLAIHVSRVSAQAPNEMNYQAIVRDVNGTPVVNAPVSIRFTIHDLSANGAVVFMDTADEMTNQFGHVSTIIGSRANMSMVNWGSGAKYLQVEVELNNSGSFTDMGTSQLLSVPYAMFAGNSATGPTGAAGADGTDGSPGATGPAGINGANGVTGPTGAAGTNGVNGADGPQGATGLTGPAGINGTNGVTGSTGQAGANGINGADGQQGPPGAPGATGQTGIDGTNGVTGSIGPTGIAGINGTNGVDGATGATGPAGIDGTNGATGLTGATGSAGVNAYTTTTASYIQPAVNGNVTVYVANYGWMVQNQVVYAGNGGYYTVTQINSDGNNDGAVLLTYTGGGNIASGSTVSQGAGVSPGGLSGAGTLSSSATSVTIDTGSQTFTVQAGLPYLSGDRIRLLHDQGNYMVGNVTSYAGATLVAYVDTVVGSGSYALWNIAPVGITGRPGLLPSGSAPGNTPYWNGTAWVVSGSNLYNAGTNVGINTTSPASALSVGSSSQFQVDSNGNVPKINNVSYSFPATQGGPQSVLANDGAGNLTWDSANLSGGSVTSHIRVAGVANITLDYADFFVVVTASSAATITFPVPSANLTGRVIIVRNATVPNAGITFTTASGSYMVGQGKNTPAASINNGNSNVGEVNIRFICDGGLWWTW